MDWVALGLVPLAAIYLTACAVYIWRTRHERSYHDPWKHTRPRRKEKRK